MISSSCSDLISLGKAGISSSPSKGAFKRLDGLILFSIVLVYLSILHTRLPALTRFFHHFNVLKQRTKPLKDKL